MFGRTLVVLLVVVGLTAAPASAKRGPINTKVTVGGKAASAPDHGRGRRVDLPEGPQRHEGHGEVPGRCDGAGHARQRRAGDQLSSPKTRKGLLAGVQLQPEGLDLLKPATVRFTRRAKGAKADPAVSSAPRAPAATSTACHRRCAPRGRARRAASRPRGARSCPSAHFSTVDAFDWSTATVADLDAILYPELGVDRLSQEITKLLKDPKTTEQDLLDVYEREYKRFIDPLLKVASRAPAHQLLGRRPSAARSSPRESRCRP